MSPRQSALPNDLALALALAAAAIVAAVLSVCSPAETAPRPEPATGRH